MNQIIDGIEYVRTVYSDRHETLIPVNRVPNPHLFNLRKRLLKKNPLVCQECGGTERVQAHHIEKAVYSKTEKGHYYQDPKSNHSATNGVLLCKSCHHKIHFPKSS